MHIHLTITTFVCFYDETVNCLHVYSYMLHCYMYGVSERSVGVTVVGLQVLLQPSFVQGVTNFEYLNEGDRFSLSNSNIKMTLKLKMESLSRSVDKVCHFVYICTLNCKCLLSTCKYGKGWFQRGSVNAMYRGKKFDLKAIKAPCA